MSNAEQLLDCGCTVHMTLRLVPAPGQAGLFAESSTLTQVNVDRIDYCRCHRGRRRYQAGEVPARKSDPSRTAAARTSAHLQRHETVVLRALRDCPEGLSVEEVAERAHLSRLTAGARLTTLARRAPRALVYDSGERKRLKSSGNPATVWRITSAGNEALASASI